MARIALIGAGGKWAAGSPTICGGPTTRSGMSRSAKAAGPLSPSKGVTVMAAAEALRDAEVVILAVPDNRIRSVAAGLAGDLEPGTMVIVLDAAAPFAKELPERDDLIYFVTHPCHPPVFNDEVETEAKRDFFGGIAAKQHIVCTLMQGSRIGLCPR